MTLGMNKTLIDWVLNPDGTRGYTWNPITGCRYHDSGLCRGGGFRCYAYGIAHGRVRPLYLANQNISKIGLIYYRETEGSPRIITEGHLGHLNTRLNDPFFPRLWRERIEGLHNRNRGIHRGLSPKERGIFVCDMGELFGDWIPEEWQNEIFHAIELNDLYDRFYLLTKQPHNLRKFSPFPPNCWVGVTATNDSMFRIGANYLDGISAAIKYISLEPLLNWEGMETERTASWLKRARINWLIIGAQTKPYRAPNIEWVESIVQAADIAGVSVFLKDSLRPQLSQDYGEYPPPWAFEGGLFRQELPKG